jgi:hypothetical protein
MPRKKSPVTGDPVGYVTKAWSVVLLNKKIHTPISSVLLLLNPRQSFWITPYLLLRDEFYPSPRRKTQIDALRSPRVSAVVVERIPSGIWRWLSGVSNPDVSKQPTSPHLQRQTQAIDPWWEEMSVSDHPLTRCYIPHERLLPINVLDIARSYVIGKLLEASSVFSTRAHSNLCSELTWHTHNTWTLRENRFINMF